MKVNDLSQGSNQIQYVNQANPQDKSPAAQDIKNQETLVDKVELSAQSREIKKINDVLEMTPDVRADRVAELKKQIQEDRYQVDSEAVAGKMIDQTIIDLVK
jgi:negative regulator of flagellin synthesis FlgM